ncbi:MAG: CAP domain-containing protein [Bacillaceae bacterium]|nr:CAP domain-containing protein [Bacillaceae bacterium]
MKKLLLLFLLLIGVLIYINFEYLVPEEQQEMIRQEVEQEEMNKLENVPVKATTPVSEQFDSLIGKSYLYIEEKFGLPERIDPSAYDYQWWIYKDSLADGFMMVGIEDSKVVTVYYIGTSESTWPFVIGTSYEELHHQFNFTQDVSFNYERNAYQFQLTSEELQARPLVQMDNVFVQLYFDTFTDRLSGVRFLDTKTLIKHRPYSVHYRGELLEPEELTLSEWEKVEAGSALHVFYITNEIRKRHGLPPLEWHNETSRVAYGHSKDMSINQYFSHTSPTHGELQDRLNKQEIFYHFAGENIAANYVDAIASVEGWLNSKGHREALLHEEFTHLGVGVYQKYYTQNFITPW